ncbi:hypothetical protein PVAND_010006 [Polypedilum vanderplanki]|uniref:Glucose-methanol-choline oxidoreductase N-terminal domain-containing protein n=1 Tax=Polypedilum vanderplanki TaxID=319348 RepID=A0A9J6CFD9_POLVA|nr:hypothetical protein PVAND_010006 [Polypedilum vanderplanki]
MSVGFAPDNMQTSLLHEIFLGFLYASTFINYIWPSDYLTRCFPKFLFGIIFIGYDCSQNACQQSIANTLPTFDYIIVGSGAAGSVLAYRLAQANSERKVLLIETGNIPLIESVPPRLYPFNFNNTATHNYYIQNSTNYGQAFRNGINANCGKSIGGSTQINGMMYVCGTDSNYNEWASLTGDSSWNYTNILQYIKKHQSMNDAALMASSCAYYHSTTGPLQVTNVGEYADPFNVYLKNASVDAGYAQLDDINCGAPYNGFVNVRFSIYGGQRNSAGRAFLIPIANYSNFYMMYNTTVNKVLATKDSTTGTILITGVNVRTSISNCSNFNILASREVILSAGAYNSPQILQRSGFGKAADLNACNITQVNDLPVGYNLADHVLAMNYYLLPNINITDNFTLERQKAAYKMKLSEWGGQYISCYNDPYFPILSSGNIQGFINVNSKNGSIAPYPDIQIITIVYDQFQADFDIILNERYDTRVKAVCDLYKTPTMTNKGAQPFILPIDECANLTYCTDAYLTCYLKYMSMNLYHPTGTCKMGQSAADSVVDSKFQVFGVKRGLLTLRTNPMLRVVDASVMPNLPSGNTQCPTYTLAEKAADIILADNP